MLALLERSEPFIADEAVGPVKADILVFPFQAFL